MNTTLYLIEKEFYFTSTHRISNFVQNMNVLCKESVR